MSTVLNVQVLNVQMLNVQRLNVPEPTQSAKPMSSPGAQVQVPGTANMHG